MPTRNRRQGIDGPNRVVAEARRYQRLREQTYREQALKILPWVCGRCAREFAGKKLRELTVHHKDHNHENNPPDGSNWELLCMYCHDDEHSRSLAAEAYGEATPGGGQGPPSTYTPFAGMAALLKKKE
jgi:5-methylcytosine-specific restriction endonuclease McrA